jgi:hypothetical protein
VASIDFFNANKYTVCNIHHPPILTSTSSPHPHQYVSPSPQASPCLFVSPWLAINGIELWLVFSSPVKSGFLTPKWATVDRNRSKPLPILRGPQPNRRGPVLFGSVAPEDRLRPVSTAIVIGNISYYIGLTTN